MRVKINVDSELVVRVIKDEGCSNTSYLVLIKEFKKLITDHKIVTTTHTYIDATLCADALTNMECINKTKLQPF